MTRLFLRAFAALLILTLPALAEVKIEQVISPGGIKAWLVEDHDLPFVAMDIRFKGGTSLDQPGKRGEVNLMTALLEEGSGSMDSQAFAKARDTLAAKFRFNSDIDGVEVSARFLTANRDKSLALLHQALTDPRFDQSAIERVRGQVLSVIRSNAKDPNHIASNALMARAFGSHPYGSDENGTKESVLALTRDDMLAAFKGAIARDRVFVGVAGDVTPAELGPMLDKLLGDLPAKGWPQPERATLNAKAGLEQIKFPGPQSSIDFFQGGIRFKDPNYFSALVLQEIIGGNRFGSVLMDQLREKRGLSYGVGTSLDTLDHGEMMSGHVAVANENAAEVIRIIRQEWADIAQNGVTQDQLDAAKTYMTGSYPLRFDGNGHIASILVGMQIIGLPADYPATRNDKVNAVTLADVNAEAKRFLRPDQLYFVVVGDAKGLKPSE